MISALGLLPNKVFVHWLWRVSYFKSNSYNIQSVWLALTWVIRDRDYIQRVKVNTFNNTFPILSILACYKKVRLCYWWEMLNMLKKTAHNYLEHIILKKTPPTVDKVFAIMNFDICLDRLIKQLVSYWGVYALISWQAYSVLLFTPYISFNTTDAFSFLCYVVTLQPIHVYLSISFHKNVVKLSYLILGLRTYCEWKPLI